MAYLRVNSYGPFGRAFSSLAAALGTCANFLLGGWDLMVQALIAFMALDFVLGFAASVKNHTTDSQVMFWGGVNKVLVLGLVGGRCGAGQPPGGRGALHPHGGDLVLHSEGIVEHFGELRQAGEQHPAYPQDSAGSIAGQRRTRP